MISTFQSQECGFGLRLSLMEIQKIKEFRSEKQPLYAEAESAIIINSTEIKQPIVTHLFSSFLSMVMGRSSDLPTQWIVSSNWNTGIHKR
jgi:hypothetical protein